MGWSLRDTSETYALPHWSDGYFDIDAKGRLTARPWRDPARGEIPLAEVAAAAEREGLALPVLVRFTDILRDRVVRLSQAFAAACGEYGYGGTYTPVYPIKVNQQRSVVEAILHAPVPRIGLEAGSKPELLALLALAPRGTRVICNGYKDRAYVRLALIGRQLGLDMHIVVEKSSELDLILAESEALGIEPRLGVRLRLASVTSGKWQNSGGEKAKFGLPPAGVLALVETLQSHGRLDWLTLMHFHVGSQVTDIHELKKALREAGRYYAELRRLGVPVTCVDGGGGLGVDYEGTRSNDFCSVNYTLEEYAHTLVRAFAEICAEADLPHPDLVTESGRSLTAHHAVLITDVTEVETVPATPPPATDDTPAVLADLRRALDRLDHDGPVATFHDAWFDLQEARTLYTQGKLTLAQLAEAEQLSQIVARRVRERLDIHLRAHRDLLDHLNDRLADKVFCNFSVFQSLPDAWAIGQIFPVVPLQRLDEPPTRRGRIMDLTCDSDGTLNRYVDRQSVETTLALHAIAPGERYLLGFFLVGAYQEILGDMHNLFGDTHSVNVELDEEGHWHLKEPLRGDLACDLLRYVHIPPEALQRAFRKKLAEAELPPARRRAFENELVSGLNGYTYLED
ncbi:arginine decarboxylase [Methylomarinovum caldicuralii]|uniref:Arginine decarboxylase n=1 Tax=Methylomarinovum caldicuralii TaxID=438856 RepID=A0AAU9C1T8_9GAMM|nr:biosynthetic arginine decarboxylase [Methylomarinovum caldicuralii]BCX82322.1 arginine decarboxylase [Methylomarinovum caldicuralii]